MFSEMLVKGEEEGKALEVVVFSAKTFKLETVGTL